MKFEDKIKSLEKRKEIIEDSIILLSIYAKSDTYIDDTEKQKEKTICPIAELANGKFILISNNSLCTLNELYIDDETKYIHKSTKTIDFGYIINDDNKNLISVILDYNQVLLKKALYDKIILSIYYPDGRVVNIM